MSSSSSSPWRELAKAVTYRVAVYLMVRAVIAVIERQLAPKPA